MMKVKGIGQCLCLPHQCIMDSDDLDPLSSGQSELGYREQAGDRPAREKGAGTGKLTTEPKSTPQKRILTEGRISAGKDYYNIFEVLAQQQISRVNSTSIIHQSLNPA